MRIEQVIQRIVGVGVAGALTIGGGLAFAEEGPDVETEAPTEETQLEVSPVGDDLILDQESDTDVVDVEDPDDGTHEHPDNHGKVVSETAHATPPGPGHGAAVSEAARSKGHGRPDAEAPAQPEVEPDVAPVAEPGTTAPAVVDVVEPAADPAPNGHGRDHAPGQGNAQDRGEGHGRGAGDSGRPPAADHGVGHGVGGTPPAHAGGKKDK